MRIDIDLDERWPLFQSLRGLCDPHTPSEALKSAVTEHFMLCVTADRAKIRLNPVTNEVESKQTRKGRTLIYRSKFLGSVTDPSIPCRWGEPTLHLQ